MRRWTPIAWLAFCSLVLGAAAAHTAEGDGDTSFEELVADAEVAEGFFDTYRKGDHLYLAIPPARFGEPFLAVPRIAQGIGARGLHANQIYDRVEAEVVVLERHGERVFLKQVPHRFTAEAGSPAAVAVGRSFGASVLAAAKVEAERADGAAVIDVYPWVVSDLFNVEHWVRQALGEPGSPAAVSLDSGRSHLVAIHAYPKNLEIRAQLTFRPAQPQVLDSVPDGRFVPLAMHFSFVASPATPMTPRLADDRLGLILSVHKNYSQRGEPVFFERIANRWRLEPGEAVGDKHRPVGTVRRQLQRAWLERMAHLLLADDARLPADARSVTRAALGELRARLAPAVAAGGLDAYTRAHLEEAAARIEMILAAQLTASLP